LIEKYCPRARGSLVYSDNFFIHSIQVKKKIIRKSNINTYPQQIHKKILYL
jgi:hypothetical protein